MITEARFTDTLTLIQLCPLCKQSNTLNGDELQLGVIVDTVTGPDIIPLPPCPKCGGAEQLNRYVDSIPEQLVTDHRIIVNTIADYLKSKGLTLPECREVYSHEAPLCAVTGSFANGSVLTARPNLPVM